MKTLILFLFCSALVFGQANQNNFPGGGSGSGTVGNCTGAGNSFYNGAGTTVGCDTNIVDNGTGVFTFSGTGPNIILPAGTVTNPSLNFVGNASNTGLYSNGSAVIDIDIAGVNKIEFAAGALRVANTGSLAFSQTASGNGAQGPNLSVNGTGANEMLLASTATIDGGKCVVNALAIGNTQTTICSFTLPATATSFAVECFLKQVIATTPTTIALGYQFGQSPTNPSFTAENWTSNANAMTDATNTTGSTTANTILTGGTPGSAGTFKSEVHGTFTSSATSGTLIIFGTAGAAGDIVETGTCWLH